MSDTPTSGAEAPAPAVTAAAPPETVAPQPEARALYVTLKPIISPEKAIGAGEVVSLTTSQAADNVALIRPATAVDLSRWGRAPLEL